MNGVNVADAKMIEEIRGCNTITLDIDSGDKEFKLNSHFDSMIEIGAFIIAQSRATTVRIIAMDDNNKYKIIEFKPENGSYNIVLNQWVNNTPSIVELEITEPTDDALWEAMHNNDIKAETGRRSWYFKGKRSDLENFITGYYARNDREQQQEFFDEIKIDVVRH